MSLPCLHPRAGYVTSIMVQQAAGITWGDFFKFGLALQLLISFLAPALTMVFIVDRNTTAA